jgi:putative ABC transport system permease protein
MTEADVGYLGEHAPSVMVRGTTDAFLAASTLKVATGHFLSPVEVDLQSAVVVIGADVQSRLFQKANPLGARITIAGDRYTVVGTLATQGSNFGHSLDNIVIIPYSRFERRFGRQNLSIAAAAYPGRLNEAEDEMIEALRRARGLAAGDDDTFSLNRQSDLVAFFNEGTQALFGVAFAVGLITLLVGGIGVMNIMLVAVTERTREIGVRRAIGARRRTILAQFLLEAMLVTLAGGAVGTLAGLGGAKLISIVTPLSAKVSPQAGIAGLLFSAVVGLIFGTWPAYRAASLDPIESLRYE